MPVSGTSHLLHFVRTFVTFGCLSGLLLVDCTWAQVRPTASRGRRLAPDVLEVIRPGHEYGDTSQGPVDLPFVAQHPELAWTPQTAPKSETLLELSKRVVFRGDVYGLEFAFKPVRMIELEIPTPEGYRTKNVWYLLYRVRYLGGDHRPVREESPFKNEVYSTQAVSSKWVRFFPKFTMNAIGIGKYMESPSVLAKRAIAARERVGKKIYDTVEAQTLKLEISTETEDHSVWGVATWTDVDPRTDFFTIEVKGLTNAQRIEQSADGKWDFKQKALVLYFSRPGDTVNELQDRIRFGIPALEDDDRQKYVLDQFGVEKRLDYMWDYR